MNILSNIRNGFDAWWSELKKILKDEGAIIFCIVLPLGYPILYSWIYNNEVTRDVPVVVVDNSHSAQSREFIQKFDASPDVSVALRCPDMESARKAIAREDAFGILYFPEDFAIKTGRMEQTHVSVYCDMGYMLAYKAIFTTATAVSQMMGSKITAQLQTSYTARDAELSAHPLEIEEVPIFNTTKGYGNFVLPAVLILIIQQAMLLCVGLVTGSEREQGFPDLVGVISTLTGKAAAFITVFSVMAAYVTLAVPHMFGFVNMVHAWDLIQLMVPYLLACTFFAISLSSLIRYREYVMLLAVFTSIPLLFLSGVSWPQTNLPSFWASVAYVAPSTFGIRAFIRMNSMGALAPDVVREINCLWGQVVLYALVSIIVMYRRYQLAQKTPS